MMNVCERLNVVHIKRLSLDLTYLQDHNLEYARYLHEQFATTSNPWGVRYIIAYAVCSVLYVYDSIGISMYFILCKHAL